MNRSTRGRVLFPALAAAAALTLAACGDATDDSAEFESDQAQAEEPTTEPETTETPQDEGTPEEPEETDEAPTGGPLDPEDAIETIVYEVPGNSSDTVEVGLHDLRVEGDVMLLELSFTGEFSDRDSNNIFMMFGGKAIYPELNDRENLKQYTVIGQGHERWSTDSTNSGAQYESGQTAPYWAYYAAPVDDIETITVTVIPGAVEFEDVEINRDGQAAGGSADDADQNGDPAEDGE